MKKSVKKTYNSEFRETAVKLALDSNKSISEIANELDMKSSTLHTWVSNHKAAKKGNDQPSSDNLQEQLKKLKKEHARLKEENLILKKASAYFAQHVR